MELLQRQVDGIKDELQVGWSHVRGWGGSEVELLQRQVDGIKDELHVG